LISFKIHIRERMFDHLVEIFLQNLDTIMSGIIGGGSGFFLGKTKRKSVEVETLIKTIQSHEKSITFQAQEIKGLRDDLNKCYDSVMETIEKKIQNNKNK
jgi:hypothetical protein